jgi:hypothetical protein
VSCSARTAERNGRGPVVAAARAISPVLSSSSDDATSPAFIFDRAPTAMADDLAGFLAGLVLECDEIPNKDKLRELKVDVGADEPLTIVTNASNVKSGYASSNISFPSRRRLRAMDGADAFDLSLTPSPRRTIRGVD